jgi:hypothetical protein
MTWFPWSLDDTTMAPRMGSEADGFVYDQIKIGDEAIHSLRAGRHNFIQDWFWWFVTRFFQDILPIAASVYLWRSAGTARFP